MPTDPAAATGATLVAAGGEVVVGAVVLVVEVVASVVVAAGPVVVVGSPASEPEQAPLRVAMTTTAMTQRMTCRVRPGRDNLCDGPQRLRRRWPVGRPGRSRSC